MSEKFEQNIPQTSNQETKRGRGRPKLTQEEREARARERENAREGTGDRETSNKKTRKRGIKNTEQFNAEQIQNETHARIDTHNQNLQNAIDERRVEGGESSHLEAIQQKLQELKQTEIKQSPKAPSVDLTELYASLSKANADLRSLMGDLRKKKENIQETLTRLTHSNALSDAEITAHEMYIASEKREAQSISEHIEKTLTELGEKERTLHKMRPHAKSKSRVMRIASEYKELSESISAFPTVTNQNSEIVQVPQNIENVHSNEPKAKDKVAEVVVSPVETKKEKTSEKSLEVAGLAAALVVGAKEALENKKEKNEEKSKAITGESAPVQDKTKQEKKVTTEEKKTEKPKPYNTSNWSIKDLPKDYDSKKTISDKAAMQELPSALATSVLYGLQFVGLKIGSFFKKIGRWFRK